MKEEQVKFKQDNSFWIALGITFIASVRTFSNCLWELRAEVCINKDEGLSVVCGSERCVEYDHGKKNWILDSVTVPRKVEQT